MLNSVIMMGRLTDNPEKRETPTGVSCARFTIAVERSFVRQGEERKTDFFDVVAWRNNADFACRYFSKGQLVCVQGSMETRTYDDKNGVRRKAYTLVAERLHFAEAKRDSYNQSAPVRDDSQAAPSFSNVGAEDTFQEIDGGDDDLPF